MSRSNAANTLKAQKVKEKAEHLPLSLRMRYSRIAISAIPIPVQPLLLPDEAVKICEEPCQTEGFICEAEDGIRPQADLVLSKELYEPQQIGCE